MLTDQSTYPDSVADYWINKVGIGSWKTADKLMCCINIKCQRCVIVVGEKYLDTGELSNKGFNTVKVCKFHANMRVT